MNGRSAVMQVRALDALIDWSAPPDVLEWLRAPLSYVVADGGGSVSLRATFEWSAVVGGWTCVNDGDHIRSDSLVECLSEAMIVMNRLAARSVARDRLVLHAGVVTRPSDGGAIAFCGPSGAGKSTATATAVLAGYGFVADEVCALDEQTRTVRPYPRPIGLRQAGAKACGIEIDVGMPWLPPSVHDGEPELAMVVLVDRRPGPAQATLINPADALAELTQHTLGDHGHERETFRRLASFVRTVPVVRAQYEHAVDAIATLLATMTLT